MNHLLNDSRKHMSAELVGAELQIRRNPSMSYVGMRKHSLFQKKVAGNNQS